MPTPSTQRTRTKRARAKQARQPTEKQFLKRRTVEQGIKLADDAHAATWRLYCEVFRFWRSCRMKRCRRERRCMGEPAACLMRGLPSVTPAERLAADKEVIAGGPRRTRPATHMEYVVRRQTLPMLTTWRGAAGEAFRPREAGEGDHAKRGGGGL